MRGKNHKFERGFKSKAEKIATEFRKNVKLKPHNPLPSRKLAKYLNIGILTPSKIPGMNNRLLRTVNRSKEWSAITLQLQNKDLLIIHNEKNSVFRQESDIMHEIAHVIQRHSFDGIKLNQSSIILRDYNLMNEKEAEWLGACLQLNRESLLWSLRKKMDIEAISEFFSASKDMVTFRINVTGVLNQYPYFNPFV